jgi:hypothetical protein
MDGLQSALEDAAFGAGLTHADCYQAVPPCERCHGAGVVGHPAFPVQCPVCYPLIVTETEEGEED